MGILRVILAITVVIVHLRSNVQGESSLLGFTFTGGVVAVETFFIISGFYMTMILNNKYVGKGSYKLFLSNRFLRLYPIYWTIALLTVVLSIVRFVISGNYWGKLSYYVQYYHVMTFKTLLFLIFTNLVLFGQDVTNFLGMNPESGTMFFTSNFADTNPPFWRFLLVPQAWTLGVELVFYLIAPFIVRRSILLIIGITIGSLFIRGFIYFHLGYSYDPWIYRFFPSELALFLWGAISFRMYLWLQNSTFGNKNKYLVVVVFFTVLIFYQFLPFKSGYFDLSKIWAFYLLTGLSLPFIFQLSKSSKYDNRIGELSYPIYISHSLVIVAILPFLKYFKFQTYASMILILSTIIVSYILMKAIADPIEKVRQSRIKIVRI